ncbi:MAG: hypothetical protein Q7T26_09975 [Dehalococcoidia bacterium]|nr:hypothetical protein [Dehalococcoidia bacterium]
MSVLLRTNADVRTHLSDGELNALADYAYYIRHVDAIFRRVGL